MSALKFEALVGLLVATFIAGSGVVLGDRPFLPTFVGCCAGSAAIRLFIAALERLMRSSP